MGGTERSAANISKVLADEHNVLLALYDGTQIKYSFAGRLIDFQLPPKKTFLGKVLNTFLRDVKLRKLIKQEQIDILYTFTAIGNRQTRYPYNTGKIISARDFGRMFEKSYEYKKALNKSAAMICNSEYTKQFYLLKYPEDRDKVFSLYNYIDIAEIREQALETVDAEFLAFLNQHEKTIVAVGRFCKEKGFEYLIDSFSKAREKNQELGLVLIGDGEYKAKYLEAIEKCDVGGHVYFTGFQKNPYKYMSRCRCFVLSSLSEGFPNALAEAMALGLPVIADNCYSGPAEILRRDQNYNSVTDIYQECEYGILTPRITEADNRHALAQLAAAMKDLLSSDEKMQHYAKLSIERACEFSREAVSEKLDSIFEELLERRNRRDSHKK